ncbi:class I SAM-dependent methyltransferase [Streptomyces albus subsp. chlorinus]|uniref:Type 12 methyltransferase n=1 Tax=Streptomyces albus subsp. chlorinus TaxID=337066 RepID=A0A386KTY6_9ACTN|nr:methyltransferase domain-containing protein [Streptomyces albus]AYD88524.1 type 12 methyltransferase [Streptomyces albus subsp. chlorinus]NSC25497.1 class I SAM-dependent methyltransferase [Streptomyces albus subsp. chlorinus]
MFAYSASFLSGYDLLVHKVTCPLFWRCSTRHLIRLYRRHTGDRHLDVGPGTGSLLRRSGLRSTTAVHLLDRDEAPLRTAREALPDHHVQTYQQDVFERWALDEASVDSVAMSLVFHTLPGQGIGAKAHAVEEAARVLGPDGRFFGATLVRHGRGVKVPARARWLMDAYNRRGIFANAHDDADDLEAALRASFRSVHLWSRGCAALWVAFK